MKAKPLTRGTSLRPNFQAPRTRKAGAPWMAIERYRSPSKPFGVNLLGLLQSEKGVGEAARTTARALAAAGIPIAFNNYIDDDSVNLDESIREFHDDNPYPVNLIHLNGDFCAYLGAKYPWYFKDRFNIGFWNWELEQFPEGWMDAFRSLDEVWAPSTFTQRSIARVSPCPVFRVPYAIDIPPCPADNLVRSRFRLPRNTFVFLFAFDVKSIFARKNPIAVVEAFRLAFGQRRDVALAIKLIRSESCPRMFAELVTACRGQANIRILREALTRTEMYVLLSLCDAYVSLHRSEGFGLPLAEAMALGKPVIATNYSANVDFMDESNSLPVRYRMVTIDQDDGPYRHGAQWADPDVTHAAEQMCRLVDTPGLAAALGARAQADITRTISPQAVGMIVRQRLEEIHRSCLPSCQAC